MSSEHGGHALTINQQALWRYQRRFPHAATYGMLGIARARTRPDVAALQEAYYRLLARHEILRCRIEETDGVARAVPQPVAALPRDALLRCIDGSEWTQAQWQSQVETRFAAAHETSRASLFEACLVLVPPSCIEDLVHGRAGTGDPTPADLAAPVGVLVFTAHHLVIDLLSFSLLLEELEGHYREVAGFAGSIPAFRAGNDYWRLASWERAWLSEASTLQRTADYLARLSPLPEPLDFGSEPAAITAANPVRERRFELSSAAREGVQRCAGQFNVTPFVVMLSIFQVFLHVHGGSNDICVATPTHGRPRREFNRTIGYFANVLPLRQQVHADDTLTGLMASNEQALRQGLRISPVPFALLAGQLGASELQPGRSALAQVGFTWDAMHDARADAWLDMLYVEQRDTPYALSLTVYARKTSWQCGIKHDPAVVPDAVVNHCMAELESFMHALCAAPTRPVGGFALVRPPDWHQGTPTVAAVDAIETALAHRAAIDSHAPALRQDQRSLSAGEFAALTQRMAGALRERMPGGGRVGILMERGMEGALAMVAAFRAGIAYVPLHPDQPEAWLSRVCERADVGLVVHSAMLAARVAELAVSALPFETWLAASDAEPSAQWPYAHPLSEAYVIHTSGSTGLPKGVAVSRLGLQQMLAASRFIYEGEAQRWTLLHHPSFDFAMWELWGPLVHGHCLSVIDDASAASPMALHDVLERDRITHIGLTPPACRLLLPLLLRRGVGTLRVVCLGGSAIDRELAGELAALGLKVWSFYGPTEATVWATCGRIDQRQPSGSIGFPFAGMRAYVLGSQLQWVPEHQLGDLYLAGPQLAQYVNAPRLTAEAFVPDPWHEGERMYRTGDRVRYSLDSGLRFAGRADRQVKVNGYRIELEGVANLLRSDASIADIVCMHTPRYGVCAFYVTVDGAALPAERLAGLANRVLPKYVLPVRFVHRDAIPMSRNAKPDLPVLAAELDSHGANEPAVAGAAQWLDIILRIIAAELELPEVDADVNFHQLGATSIILARIHDRLAALAGPLDLVDLYAFPTPNRLARWLVSRNLAPEPPEQPAISRNHWQTRRVRRGLPH